MVVYLNILQRLRAVLILDFEATLEHFRTGRRGDNSEGPFEEVTNNVLH